MCFINPHVFLLCLHNLYPSILHNSRKIPDLLWFTYRRDLLGSGDVLSAPRGFSPSEELLAANIRQTLRVHSGARGRCLDDGLCMEMLAVAEGEAGIAPKADSGTVTADGKAPPHDSVLVRAFRRERDGSFRGDLWSFTTALA